MGAYGVDYVRLDAPSSKQKVGGFTGLAALVQPGLHLRNRRVSALLQSQLDTFDQQIMDFAPLVEGNLPQRLVGGLRQIDTRMLDIRPRPAACGLCWGASSARGGSAAALREPY